MSLKDNEISVMVADGDDKIRQYISTILTSRQITVLEAKDGEDAITTIQDNQPDIAILNDKLKHLDGFGVARAVKNSGLRIGMIMMTENPTTDTLLAAGNFGIGQVMQKPIEPDRLLESVKRMLRVTGKNMDGLRASMEKTYTAQELMQRAIALGRQNANAGLGGPFGAVVADEKGRILGEGVNSVHTRSDPTAHAEVVAIRRATERLGEVRLDGCQIFISSEPTMLGQALIIGTGIKDIYYGISHDEAGTPRISEEGILGEISKPIDQRTVNYHQLCHDEAMESFVAWQNDQI